jgi:predicted nucleic acid-binding protein
VNTGWLLDTSAVAVSHRPEVAQRLGPMLRAGLLYTCPVLDLEVLATARSPESYRTMAAERRDAYRSAPLAASVGDRALALQSKLSRRARSQAVEPRDLFVAATAIENDLTVLHYHQVFETLGELCRLNQRAVAPLGSLA